ncbi:MAG: dTDP-4-dehydrorhamnose 3,5-epimerase [Bacteroidetes bacterium]|nr:dTDP-4-dehydrorhamnose 3,5-epimerase [Bacteroidota bacterium]
MNFYPTPLAGAYIVELTPFTDHRGWFARGWCKNEFAQIGHTKEFVNLNHSYTKMKGTIRGMHFQRSPHREIKLLRCIAGSVFDVIVDLREGSPTYSQWFGAELSARNRRMMYVPEGFAHGFQTLEEDSEVIYLVSEFYAQKSEGGVRYSDPAFNIQWPLPVSDISEKDAAHPFINETFKAL